MAAAASVNVSIASNVNVSGLTAAENLALSQQQSAQNNLPALTNNSVLAKNEQTTLDQLIRSGASGESLNQLEGFQLGNFSALGSLNSYFLGFLDFLKILAQIFESEKVNRQFINDSFCYGFTKIFDHISFLRNKWLFLM